MDSIQQKQMARKQIPVLKRENRFVDKIIWVFVVWWLVDLVGKVALSFYMSSLTGQELMQLWPVYQAIKEAWYFDLATFVIGPVLFGLFLLKLVLWKRAAACVRKADFRLCIFCKYPLTGIQEVGLCPECGKPFDIKETQRLWRAAIDTLKSTK